MSLLLTYSAAEIRIKVAERMIGFWIFKKGQEAVLRRQIRRFYHTGRPVGLYYPALNLNHVAPAMCDE